MHASSQHHRTFVIQHGLFVALLAFGCGAQDSTSTALDGETAAIGTDATTIPSDLVPVPADVNAEILSESTAPTDKKGLVVRLNKSVSKDVLRTIAYVVRARHQSSFERSSVTYYLSGMDVGAGAWALTQFQPEFEVIVFGLSPSEHASMGEAAKATPDLIGFWFDNRPGAGTVVLTETDGRVFLDRRFKDGSNLKFEAVESPLRDGRRFHNPVSEHTDFYVLKPDGSLEIRDADGLIATLRQ